MNILEAGKQRFLQHILGVFPIPQQALRRFSEPWDARSEQLVYRAAFTVCKSADD